MTKNKKIAIGITFGVVIAGASYLIYRRYTGKQNSALLREFISKLPKENTTAAQSQLQDAISASVINEVDSTSAAALKGKVVVLDGKAYTIGKTDKTDFSDKAYRIATSIHDSVSGAGTNVDNFISSFKRIGNKNAMVFMNIYYKAIYKETMWQAINNETALYYGSKKSIDVYNLLDFPNYNPLITKHLQTIK